MTTTYNQLKELSALYRGPKNFNQIALDYQDTEDAILLSYTFCENMGLISQITQSYFGLTEMDVDSYALEELHKAMMHFKEDSGAKLTTLYSRFLKNRLRAETQALNYDKRVANAKVDSLDGEDSENEFGLANTYKMQGYHEDRFNEIDILTALTRNDALTENEFKYCQIIVKEVRDVEAINNSEIAEQLNMTSAGLHYLKKSLRKKLGVGTNGGQAILSF